MMEDQGETRTEVEIAIDARPKVLTEKAQLERIHALKNKQTYALSNVTRCRNELANCMTDENNLHDVKTGLSKYNELCKLYQEAHEEYCEILQSESETDKEVKRFEDRQNSILEFRRQVSGWIKTAECTLSEQCDSVSSHGRSSYSSRHSRHSKGTSRSSHSGRSSVSARAKEKAKIAELTIEQSILMQKCQLKMQEDKLRLDAEIAKARARERIYAEEQAEQREIRPQQDIKAAQDPDRTPSHGGSDMTERFRQVPNPATEVIGDPDGSHMTPTSNQFQLPVLSSLNHQAAPFIPQMPTLQCNAADSQSGLATSNALLSALTLPQPEVPKFAGDPISYHSFKAAFNTRVVSRTSSNTDRLYYLDQHLVGEPKDIISMCFHLDPDIAYSEACKLLDREYGDSYKISVAYLSKLNDWPIVKVDDNVGLKKLSIYLNKCCQAMRGISELNVLNHPPNMVGIVKKLPMYLQNKWREHACKSRQNHQKAVQFQDLVNFICSASDIANDPIYGNCTNSGQFNVTKGHHEGKKYVHKDNKQMHGSSFASMVKSEHVVTDKCPMCNQLHDLEECNSFLSKSIEERRNFLKDKQLCFGCFTVDHTSRGCRNKRKCKKCGKLHPTSLHIDGFQLVKSQMYKPKVNSSECQNDPHLKFNDVNIQADVKAPEHTSKLDSNVCTATKIQHSTVLHAILPVKIKQKDCEKVVTTYCFYDNGSSGCFMTDTLYDQLNATGLNSNLQLKTMHGCSYVRSTAVENLVMTDMNGVNPVELPRTYTKSEIPISTQQIPRQEMTKQWPKLHSVKLPEFQEGLEVGLLIGNNCPSAI